MSEDDKSPTWNETCDGCGLPLSFCVCDEEEEEFDLIED